MSHRLIYVVGPSGAGKDSLMRWLRERTAGQMPLHWVRRTVTRAVHNSSTDDMGLDESSFQRIDLAGGFALQWQANGLRYGIRHEELTPIARQQWVFLNGSRAYLPVCANRYPGMSILHITADPAVLRQRLLQRGRETGDAVDQRLQRVQALVVPAQSQLLEVFNNSSLEEAGRQLLQQLERLPGWPCKLIIA